MLATRRISADAGPKDSVVGTVMVIVKKCENDHAKPAVLNGLIVFLTSMLNFHFALRLLCECIADQC
jgi:hypothetical protein